MRCQRVSGFRLIEGCGCWCLASGEIHLLASDACLQRWNSLAGAVQHSRAASDRSGSADRVAWLLRSAGDTASLRAEILLRARERFSKGAVIAAAAKRGSRNTTRLRSTFSNSILPAPGAGNYRKVF